MYFREIDRQYSMRTWYIRLRGVINLGFGVAVFFTPDYAIEILLQLFGIWVIVNNVIQLTPMFLGRRTRRLYPEILASSIIGFTIGVIAFTRGQLAVEIASTIVGILLVFRVVIELIILVESYLRVEQQRHLLLWIALTLFLGIYLVLNPLDSRQVFQHIIGIYAIIMGLNHILTASWMSKRMQEGSEQVRSVKQGHIVPVLRFDQLVLDKNEYPPLNQEDWKDMTPGERIPISKYQRPMIIAAHPDDLEAFAGGLVFQLQEVLSVIFAGGDKGVWDPKYKKLEKQEYINLRLDEAAKAGRILGLNKIIYMGYLDRGFKCTEETIQQTLDLLEWYKPDLIIAFEYNVSMTIDPHPDHLNLGEVTRQAVMRLEKPHKFDLVLMSTLIPNVFVNVSIDRRIKLEALATHSSQIGFNSIVFPFLEKLITRMWGVFNGYDYAEGYRLIIKDQLKKNN